MGKVRGEDVVLYLENIGDKCNQPIACARSITFDIQQDLIETSITGNGRFRTYVPGAASWNANCEGLVALKNINTITVTGQISRYENLGIEGFIIDIPDLCIKIGGTLIVSGTGAADGSYIVLNFGTTGGGTETLITVTTPVPNFTTINASLTYQELNFGMENMYDSIIAGTNVFLEFYETDVDGNYLKKTGTAYIESLNETSSFDNMATFTVNLKGTGPIEVEYG